MRKIIALFLSFVMVFSVFATVVNAKEKTDDERIAAVLKEIKSRIPDTENYEEFRANIRTYKDNSYFEFEWKNTTDNKYMSVVVCENGVITDYNIFDEGQTYDNTPTINKKSVEEAGKRALELLILLNPMLENKIEVILPEYNNLYGNEYNFSIKRIENGIDVRGNTGNVSIDKNAEKIRNFYLNYSPHLTFSDKTLFMNKEDAEKAYNNTFGMKTVYNIEYKNGIRETRLAYELSNNYNEYIDAVKGEIYKYNPEYNTYASGGGINAKNESALMRDSVTEAVKLSEAELKEINKISGLMPKEEIISSIRSNTFLEIDDDAVITGFSLIRNYNDKNKYNYSISMNCPDDEKGYSISVDAKDASIISFNRYYYNIDRTSKLTEFPVTPENYALELGSKYFTQDADNSYIISNRTDGTASYKRVVNGIECSFDSMEVVLNSYDGKLDYFYVSYSDVEFDKPDNIISVDDAEKVLFDNFDYKPVYLQENANNSIAVYDFEQRGISIDAFTGEVLFPYTDNFISKYTDIDNHYARDVINALARFGIGFSGGEFKPDDKITQGEYITLLSAIFGSYHTPIIFKEDYDFSTIRRHAENFGIYDIETDKPLTRESACVMLIKAMGYDKIASMSDLFVKKFSDVTQNIGYISILNGMKVINGDGNGNFHPQNELTRAETAIIIYNYLNK